MSSRHRGQGICDGWEAGSPVVTDTLVEQGGRMRLYLLDLPEGTSAQVLAIAIVAPAERFEQLAGAATPILELVRVPHGLNRMGWMQRRGYAPAVVLLIAMACTAQGQQTTGATAASSPEATTDASLTPTVVNLTPTILDILAGQAEPFTGLEPGTYLIDPDLHPSTSLRVTFDVPAEGWADWIGAAKFSDAGWVSVSITTVSNMVSHGCRDHSWADPPVGPSVEDLATALAALAPFRVTSAPEDVSIYGYGGMHLELTVPDLPVSDDGTFAGCDEGNLKNWVAAIDAGEPGDAFYGYTGPGYTEENPGILDVDGTRPDDRGRAVPRCSIQGRGGGARDPGLHPDRALRSAGAHPTPNARSEARQGN